MPFDHLRFIIFLVYIPQYEVKLVFEYFILPKRKFKLQQIDFIQLFSEHAIFMNF
jgi:hypothetical protein